MSEQFDSSNLMYITKEYENSLRETAKKIYESDDVKLTIDNIDKQLNDILIKMNEKINFISKKMYDPDTGINAYLEGAHSQIDNIKVNAKDMIEDGVETTQSHPSIINNKSDRNSTKFNTYDFINKTIKLDKNSPLLRFNSKNSINDDDTVHTFRINHDKNEYIKIIEFSFTYKQEPSIYNKKDGELEEEKTVSVTRVITGRFFIIWNDPVNEPGKFIIKAIIENADNTGNIIDQKIIDVQKLNKVGDNKTQDLSYILDDGPQFDLYFTTEGDSIDISIGKIVPYRWLMRKKYIEADTNKPTEVITINETIESPDFDRSKIFYSKLIDTYFIVDKENRKIHYNIGGNLFNKSIPFSPSTAIPYSGEEITDFKVFDTMSFTFLTLNDMTYVSLSNFESFSAIGYKITKVFEL